MGKFFKGCLTIVGAVVVLGIIIGIFAGGGDDTADEGQTVEKNDTEQTESKDNASGDEKKEEAKVEKAQIGDTATIDDISFTVTNANSTQEIDDADGNEFIDPVTTSNQFIVLDATIKNGKSEAITMDASFFKLNTEDGTTYEPKQDGDLMMVIPSEKFLFLEQINPGLSKDGMVVFEVPSDIKMENLTLNVDAGFWGTKSASIELK